MMRKLTALALAALLACALPYANAQDAAPATGDVSTIVNLAKGLSNLVKTPKTEKAEPAPVPDEQPVQARSAGLPVPRDAGAVLSTPSLTALDAAVGKFFKETEGEGFSVLSALRLTDFRKVLSELRLDEPAGAVVFCETTPPVVALALPIKEGRFSAFANALASAAKGKDLRVSPDGKEANVVLDLGAPVAVVLRETAPGRVVALQREREEYLGKFAPNNCITQGLSPLKAPYADPVVAFEVSGAAIRNLTAPDRPFWRELDAIAAGLKESAPGAVEFSFDDLRKYFAENLSCVRYDLTIDDYGIYGALQTQPVKGSPADEALATYNNPPPVNPNADRFFVLLPDVESPLSGQIDFPKAFADKLPKPFNRISFVEYSFGLPTQGELAAESWLFYLQVDNATEFAKELIIPKAREIGRYIGSKQVGDAASQIMGNAAEKRLERMQGRNRLRNRGRLPDPDRAAATGSAIGGLIGGLIGESSGEESAMKEQRISGFRTYVSDIETYVRQSALMRAEKEGRYAPPQGSILARNNFSVAEALISIVNGTDDLQRSILSSANAEAMKVDDSPLFARTGYLVVLDDHSILYSLGNLQLTKLGISNWQSLSRPSVRYQTVVNDRDGLEGLRRIVSHASDPANVNTIGAVRLDAAAGQAYWRWLRHYYLPNAPEPALGELPLDTPKIVVLSSLGDRADVYRAVVPHKTVSNVLKVALGDVSLLKLLTTPKTSENDDSDSGDVEIDFGE